jgi:predicted TPR repeat methyltransferase
MRPDGGGPTIDLGCGTGLAVQGLVGPIIGVDLSASMLSKAEARGIYAPLIFSRPCRRSPMRAQRRSSLRMCSSILGELAPLFRECRRVLVLGGIFIATFEDALETTDTWKLEH